MAALALYASTLAPGLTWAHDGADGGEFLAAALTNGVPHPPGYPTYLLLLQGAIRLLPGSPARAGNWLSAFCAALAAGLLADLAWRMLSRSPQRGLIALAAALAWASSPALWGQAVITEVYALNAFVVVLLLWLLWRWGEGPYGSAATRGAAGAGWLAAAALVLGLGLGNHLPLALVLPGVAILLWAGRSRLSRLFLWQGTGILALFLLGLSVYARIPLAAAAVPPVNWGGADTLQGFWWLISGRIYAGRFGGMPPGELLARLASWVRAALEQLGGGPWGAALVVVGLWQFDRRNHTWWRATGVIALLFTLYALFYRTDTSFVYLLPAWAMTALWLAAGIECIAGLLADRRAAWAFVIALLIILPAVAVWRFYPMNDARADDRAETFVANTVAQAEPGAVILTATDQPTFALWYTVYGTRQADVVPLNVNLYGYDWYRAALARRHPALFEGVGSDATLDAVLRSAADRFPLYTAEPQSITLSGLTVEAGEPLSRLRPAD